ncbi:MAG: YibE/F family protein [Firmicutes bacterium]|nr:YibE/F family protein [Bacillota bacterium]
MRQLCQRTIVVILVGLLFLALFPSMAGAEDTGLELYRGIVLTVEPAEENPLEDSGYGSQVFYVDVRILNGPFRDQVVTVYHVNGGNPTYDIFVEPGNRVLLEAEVDGDELLNVYISDHIRDTFVYILIGLFALLVLLLGGKAGLRSLISLLVTLILVSQVFLPLLLQGYNPMLLAVLLSILSIVITMVVVAGVNRKTLASILGTASGVIVAGILAFIFGKLTKLTGLSHEETQMLMYIPQGVDFNFQGLLFAGIMIGALGAVMDVGISVASSMFEIKSVSPDISMGQLFRSGMNVGRDIMGTMTNTLILAYMGSSTPLLLLFYAYRIPIERILNLDTIVTELVRAFSGSIGLVAAIPLTALAAAWLAKAPVGQGIETKQVS